MKKEVLRFWFSELEPKYWFMKSDSGRVSTVEEIEFLKEAGSSF